MPCSFPVATSHHFIVPALLADSRFLPSRENSNARQASWSIRDVSSLPVAASHNLMVPGSLAEARVLPSEDIAIAVKPVERSPSMNRSLNGAVSQALISPTPLRETSSLPSRLTMNWVGRHLPFALACSSPLATSHALRSPSSAPENSILPSGEKANDRIISALPLKLDCRLPVATSHIVIVPSSLPEATVLPSAVIATDQITSPCLKRANSFAVATSHNRTVVSGPPDTSFVPSALNTSLCTWAVLRVARSFGSWPEEDRAKRQDAAPAIISSQPSLCDGRVML